MPKPILDADTILKRATPVTGQHAHEIQPFGHLVRMPIALSEHACKESVDNLNQLLADTIAFRLPLAAPSCRRRCDASTSVSHSLGCRGPLSPEQPCRQPDSEGG